MPWPACPGRVEWVWKLWFRRVRGSGDLLLAPLDPDCSRAYPFFLMGGFVYFVVENSDGDVSSVSIIRDAGLIVARRVDTWVDIYSRAGW